MQELPQEFWQGVAQFNQQQFYACHDTLESLWMEALEPDKQFYQGILQIAVGFYHCTNLNWRGGAILLGEGINRLRSYQPIYAGVNVETLLAATIEWLQLLQQAADHQALLVEYFTQLPAQTSAVPDTALQLPLIQTV